METHAARLRLRHLPWLLLIASVVLFVWRGPVRALGRCTDFAVLCCAANAWVHGQDPYDAATIARIWQAMAPTEHDFSPSGRPVLYPPVLFPLIAPFSLGTWPFNRAFWLTTNVILLAATILCVARHAALTGTARRTWPIFAAAILLLAPVQTSVSLGQLAVADVALMAFALATRRSSPYLSGVLFGMALALKPQISLVFGLLYAAELRVRALAAAALTVALLAGIAIARLEVAQIDWFNGLRGNLTAFAASGGGDASPANFQRHEMLQLEVTFFAFSADPTKVRLLALGTVGILVLGIARVAWKNRRSADTLAIEAAFSLLSLLAVYHRTYDAVLLIFPLAWAFREWEQGSRKVAVIFGLTLLPFFVSGSAGLFALEKAGRVAPTWLWRHGILLHANWALLISALLLWLVAWRSQSAAENG